MKATWLTRALSVFCIPVPVICEDVIFALCGKDSDPEHNSIQEMYTFTFEDHLIWGASARMLKQITTKLK